VGLPNDMGGEEWAHGQYPDDKNKVPIQEKKIL
jgi:hypothetical protein